MFPDNGFSGMSSRAMRPMAHRVEIITVSKGSRTPRSLRKESQRHKITTMYTTGIKRFRSLTIASEIQTSMAVIPETNTS